MSKSKRSQQRYAESWRQQTTLDGFISTSTKPPQPAIDIDAASNFSDNKHLYPLESAMMSIVPQTRCASERDTDSQSDGSDHETQSIDLEIQVVMPPPPSAAVSENGREHSVGEELELHIGGMSEDVAEELEHELDESVQRSIAEIRDWGVLRTQIKQDLKKRSNTLKLLAINQLMILSNFATLQLKGALRITASEEIARQWHEGEGKHFARRVRALARHYQIFEQLSIKCRGRYKDAWSILGDENVKKRVLSYLQGLSIGKITPMKLQAALNTVILPDLGITTKKPLCVRTACRWLIKLGWRNTVVKKGVYMDGHERADVVDYHQKIFLPAMEEWWMARYEGLELKCIPPTLAPGEREITMIKAHSMETKNHAVPGFERMSNLCGRKVRASSFMPLHS